MKSLNDLKQSLIKARDAVPALLFESAKEYALNIKASAETKIRKDGIGNYSDVKVNPGLFIGKELNSAGSSFIDSLIEKGKKDEEGHVTIEEEHWITWGDFREAQGLQSSHVDLSYSNEMWRGMLPVPVLQKGDEYISRLAHTNDEGQSKMNWNYNRYGDFILDNADIEAVKEANAKMFIIKIKRLLK